MAQPTSRSSGPDLVASLQDALGRVAVIVCELELGESGVAYTIAQDLELDLEAALRRARDRASLRIVPEAA